MEAATRGNNMVNLMEIPLLPGNMTTEFWHKVIVMLIWFLQYGGHMD